MSLLGMDNNYDDWQVKSIESLFEVYEKDDKKMASLEERLAAVEEKLGIIQKNPVHRGLKPSDVVLFESEFIEPLVVIKRINGNVIETFPALLDNSVDNPFEAAMDVDPDKVKWLFWDYLDKLAAEGVI